MYPVTPPVGAVQVKVAPVVVLVGAVSKVGGPGGVRTSAVAPGVDILVGELK